MIRARKPSLPPQLADAWGAFLDCAEVVEGGRRVLLGTLPIGRVEPAPIGVGIDALGKALDDAGTWMEAWRDPHLEEAWQECRNALVEARSQLEEVREVAATTSELEELLEAVEDVVAPLDAFADAERAWRREWRLPRQDPRRTPGST